MKKLVTMGALTFALASCAGTVVPDSLADKAIFACETLDGEQVRVAVDVGAAMIGHTVTVDLIRALRQRACAEIQAEPVEPN